MNIANVRLGSIYRIYGSTNNNGNRITVQCVGTDYHTETTYCKMIDAGLGLKSGENITIASSMLLEYAEPNEILKEIL